MTKQTRCSVSSYCEKCGTDLDRTSCWQCFGEGGFHDCGEDCCPCLEPDLNEPCDECGGEGFIDFCPRCPIECTPASRESEVRP